MSIQKKLSSIIFKDEIIEDVKSYYGMDGWRVCANFVEMIIGIEYRVVFLNNTIRVCLFDGTQAYVDDDGDAHDCPINIGKTIVSVNQNSKEIIKSINRVLVELTHQAVL
jgi:hypothetical protein